MKTFASVWDAIEDSQSEAASMKARAHLMRALQKVVNGWDLSQKAAADRLGLTQPRLNDLLRGKIANLVLTPYLISPNGWALRCRSRCVKRHDNSVAKKNVRSVFDDFYPEDIARSASTKRPRTPADNDALDGFSKEYTEL